jgi:large subunit ribosomal protein L32
MALPGKRHPRALTHKRRSAWMARLKPAQLVACPKCNTPKRPHVVCKVCGFYKGVKVLEVKHKVTRAERRAAERAAVEREKKAQSSGTTPATPTK